jgi:RNA 3'-terminal phosphate cyclase (ATP)
VGLGEIAERGEDQRCAARDEDRGEDQIANEASLGAVNDDIELGHARQKSNACAGPAATDGPRRNSTFFDVQPRCCNRCAAARAVRRLRVIGARLRANEAAMAIVELDGSFGEGGGQILRTSLALSIITRTPIRIVNVRARRAKPGLQRQHLTSVLAAQEISGARVEGARLHSSEIVFEPEEAIAGNHHFKIGTAGSAALVLQTVLPPLMIAREPSVVTIEGGTHNSMSPPFDFLARVFAPLLARIGPKLELTLERAGFYPAGGGKIVARITPAATMQRIELLERGARMSRSARVLLSKLPQHIADRELAVVKRELGWTDAELSIDRVEDALSPANLLFLELAFEHVTELFTGFGERGTPAETVAERAVRELEVYDRAQVPVGEHLADQLLLPMALAGGGSYRTTTPSLHTTTNIEVIKRLLPIRADIAEEPGGRAKISISS